MKRTKVILVGFLFALTMVLATSEVRSQTFPCYWPAAANGYIGYVITQIDSYGDVIVFHYNPTGDMFAYTLSAGGPVSVKFSDGSVLPAFFFGDYKGIDPVSGVPIYEFFVSGTGYSGSFVSWGNQGY